MELLTKTLAPFQKALRQSVSSFINLETADSKTVMVSTDGSLITYFKVEGSRQIIGQEEYQNIIEQATIKIGSRFDRLGHAIQVYYVRDPDRIGLELEKAIKPVRVTADSVGMEIQDLLDERVRHLKRFLSHEESYFVLWTRPSALTKNEFVTSSVF